MNEVEEHQPNSDGTATLMERLIALSEKHPDFAFQGDDGRYLAHDIVQYPAMMVPKMQGCILDCFRSANGSLSVIDPFVGSGTVLVEAARRGHGFTGIDLNPYAILIALVKSQRHNSDMAHESLRKVVLDAKADTSTASASSYSNIEKWFSREAIVTLSRLHRAICLTEDVQARRYLWVALGETVRVCSNARTSTFKLHIRTQADLSERTTDVLRVFINNAERIGRLLSEEWATFPSWSSARICARLANTIDVLDVEQQHDLLLSSPPYGDNATTVPYGQFSFLPLQWILLSDIPGAEKLLIANTHATDTASLGGRKRSATNAARELCSMSPALSDYLQSICGKGPVDGAARVLAYSRDLLASLRRCCQFVKPGGYLVWTLGNRRVGNVELPLDRIVEEFSSGLGCCLVSRFKRRIPSKRMAVKNSVSDTMKNETLVVFKNGL